MVHRSMENGSRVADELYIKRVLMVLEDFLFFSLYSFSCIASNSTTSKRYSDLCLSIRISSLVLQHPYHLRPTPPVTHLGRQKEAFDAEMYAMSEAMKIADEMAERKEVTRVMVFTDSQATLRRIQSDEPGPGQVLAL